MVVGRSSPWSATPTPTICSPAVSTRVRRAHSNCHRRAECGGGRPACPVAMDDSWLPGGVHITAGKLRGVESYGMLCSLKELGLTTTTTPTPSRTASSSSQTTPDLLP